MFELRYTKLGKIQTSIVELQKCTKVDLCAKINCHKIMQNYNLLHIYKYESLELVSNAKLTEQPQWQFYLVVMCNYNNEHSIRFFKACEANDNIIHMYAFMYIMLKPLFISKIKRGKHLVVAQWFREFNCGVFQIQNTVIFYRIVFFFQLCSCPIIQYYSNHLRFLVKNINPNIILAALVRHK